MSAMGMFAAALGGAAGAVNQQAVGDIEQQRKTDLMQVQAELERSKLQFAETLRQGGMRADFNFTHDKGTVATVQATARSNTLAAGKNSRDAKVAEAGDTAYQGAMKAQGDREAADTAERDRAKVTAAARDEGFMKASKAIKLNDPEVAQRIATARAAAAESGARAGILGIEQERAKRVANLLDDADKILADKTITSEEERAKQFAVVQRRIALLNPKLAGASGRDPELDTQTEEVTRINPDGSQSKVTSKTVRKPGSIGADAGSASTPPPEAVAILLADKDGKNDAQFDKWFGKGSAAKIRAEQPAAPKAKGSAEVTPAPKKKPAEYGLLSAGRVSYLQGLPNRTAAEQEELDQLLATKDSAWFRGKATGTQD